MYEEKQRSGILSVIVTLSIIIGALASIVAILYVFREKLGLTKWLGKKHRKDDSWEDCCLISDDCDEAYLQDDVLAE